MRNMSFMLTTQQMIDETKDVTRRVGWRFLKVGDVVMAVEKGMGLKKGERIRKLYPIEFLSLRWERLNLIVKNPVYGLDEVRREGFSDMTPEQFVDMFCESHNCNEYSYVHRLEFRKWAG